MVSFGGGSNEHLVTTPNELVIKIGIIGTFAIFVLLAFLVLYKKVKFDGRALIEFGLWSLLICTCFLPSMHERYLFIGDILGLLYLIYNKDKYYIPLGIELVSLYGYLYFLFSGFALDMRVVSIFYFVIVILYSKEMFQRYFTCKEDDV